MHNADPLARLSARIVRCRACPRLVAHREAVAAEPPRRHRGQTYWARPLPGFGDPRARLLLVGLAPAAHGGNRTGRMFTGDQSGHWLFFFKAGDRLARMTDDALLGVVVRADRTHTFADGSVGPVYLVRSMDGQERAIDADELERTARLR